MWSSLPGVDLFANAEDVLSRTRLDVDGTGAESGLLLQGETREIRHRLTTTSSREGLAEAGNSDADELLTGQLPANFGPISFALSVGTTPATSAVLSIAPLFPDLEPDIISQPTLSFVGSLPMALSFGSFGSFTIDLLPARPP